MFKLVLKGFRKAGGGFLVIPGFACGRPRRGIFFFSTENDVYHRDARGFAFPVCRGSDSVSFASLVEVLAAHTAENEFPMGPSVYVLILVSLKSVENKE